MNASRERDFSVEIEVHTTKFLKINLSETASQSKEADALYVKQDNKQDSIKLKSVKKTKSDNTKKLENENKKKQEVKQPSEKTKAQNKQEQKQPSKNDERIKKQQHLKQQKFLRQQKQIEQILKEHQQQELNYPYQDPLKNCPTKFLKRFSEIAAVEAETKRWEATQAKFKKK